MKEVIIAGIGLAVVAILIVTAHQNYRRFHRPLLTTSYQAVTLTNGSVYYGRIDHLGSDHPVLRGAFSVQQESDPKTGEMRYVITKRTDGANGADHMIFPVTSIAFVEPVRADSTIGKLISKEYPAR
ncbi:MAG: hypothetical protein JSU95_07845 [Betaproteobacteria bacterium]|nr:MAG: hypothetical protein JSU95_07845 [Betaproteobacteria bacterium]